MRKISNKNIWRGNKDKSKTKNKFSSAFNLITEVLKWGSQVFSYCIVCMGIHWASMSLELNVMLLLQRIIPFGPVFIENNNNISFHCQLI